MTIPNPVSNKLIERVNALMERHDHSDFTLRSIEKEAKALLKADAYSAYLLLGMVSCLKRDVEAMRDNHKAALNLQNDVSANINYGHSLANIGALSEAGEYYYRAMQLAPGNPDVLGSLIENAYGRLRFHQASKYLESWKKLKPAETHHSEPGLTEFLKRYEALVLSDDEADNMRRYAEDLMVKKSIFVDGGIHITVLHEESDYWIDYAIAVEASADDVASLNYELADLIVGKSDPKVLSNVVIRYVTS